MFWLLRQICIGLLLKALFFKISLLFISLTGALKMSYRDERHWSHSKTAVHVTEPVLNVISMCIGWGVCMCI